VTPDLSNPISVVLSWGGWGVVVMLGGLNVFGFIRTWIVPWPVAKQMLADKDKVIAVQEAQILTLTKANDTQGDQLSTAVKALDAFKKFFDEVEVQRLPPHNGG
jgi:hypothetical protein